jgi:hypothetical protein
LVSERTPFPSAHARKAGLSEASERIRSSPFESRRSAGSSCPHSEQDVSSVLAGPLTRSAERLSPPPPPPSFSGLRASLLAHPMGASLADTLERAIERKGTHKS